MNFQDLDYIAPASIEPVIVERIVPTLNGGRVGLRLGFVRWRVELTLEPRVYRQVSAALHLHRTRHGIITPFNLPMPQMVSGDVVTDDDHRTDADMTTFAGQSNITLRAPVDLVLPLGWFIGFDGHQKVYQVDGVTDYTVNDAGVEVQLIPVVQATIHARERWIARPNLWCRYAENSGGTWAVNRRNIVAPVITVEEV